MFIKLLFNIALSLQGKEFVDYRLMRRNTTGFLNLTDVRDTLIILDVGPDVIVDFLLPLS